MVIFLTGILLSFFSMNFKHYKQKSSAVMLMFFLVVGPHLVVHAHQLHFGKTGSHLALKSPPSTVPHLITMATSQF